MKCCTIFFIWSKRIMTNGTLVYLFRDGEILLAMKKRGFGVGMWNGAGGKVKDGESVRDAAVRETQEEIGVTPTLGESHGAIDFTDPDGSRWTVHVFRTTEFTGEPTESEEMRPQWFPIEEIPYDLCWDDDRYWLPLLIEGKKFTARVVLGADGKVAEHEVKEM